MTTDPATRIDQLVQRQMATGRFSSRDEVVVEALEFLSDVEQFAEPIRVELRERLSRVGLGNALPLDRDAFFAEARRRAAIAD
jgi:Arc/MetJ-type ribon-helix-helix transcriptional regulator